MTNIFIYDQNIIDTEHVDQIQRDSYRCPYFFNNQIVSPLIKGKNVIGSGLQNHLISGRNDAKTISHVDEIGKYIIDKVQKKYNLNFSKILDIRSHVYLTSNTIDQTDPHVNIMENHYTLIYYVDDYDNTTYIYDQTFDINKTYSFDDLTVYKTINPGKGSVVLFEGNHYYSIGIPKDNDTRCFIIISLEIK